MIRHIVFFSARDPRDIETIRTGLSLLTDIPHADRLEIGENVKTDQLGSEVDLVVYGEFQAGNFDASIAAAAILVLAAAGVLLAVRLLQRGRQGGSSGIW